MESNYTLEAKGRENDFSYRLYFKTKDGKPLSPFHDIPLFADEKNNVFNMIVEIPRWTNAKLEIATKEALNPIRQDILDGKLRFVKNCFPNHGYISNYGAFPQTLENSQHLDEATGYKGDNDLIDVCEIGSRVHKRGAVIQVKVLGVLALIDEGETDWKIIAIDINDPLASHMNDIEDVEKLMPGLLKATNEFFTIYKVPDGKKANTYAFNGEPKNREFAHKTILDTHNYWKKMVSSANNECGLDLRNVSLNFSPHKIDNAEEIFNAAPALTEPRPVSESEQAMIDKWYHVSV